MVDLVSRCHASVGEMVVQRGEDEAVNRFGVAPRGMGVPPGTTTGGQGGKLLQRFDEEADQQVDRGLLFLGELLDESVLVGEEGAGAYADCTLETASLLASKVWPVSCEMRPKSTKPTGFSITLPSLSSKTSLPTASRMIPRPIRCACRAEVSGR